jgi:hypothetical protein
LSIPPRHLALDIATRRSAGLRAKRHSLADAPLCRVQADAVVVSLVACGWRRGGARRCVPLYVLRR